MFRRVEHPRRLVGSIILFASIGVLTWRGSPRQMLTTVAGLHGNTLLLLLFGLYLVRPFLMAPLSLFSVFVGYRYGVAVGLPLALVGTVLTCLVPFGVARYLRSNAGMLGWLSQRGEDAFETTGGVRGMTAARLSPAPADVVSYGAGLSGVSTWAFVAGTLLGELPWATGYVFVGTSMQRLSFQNLDADVELLVAGTLLALLLVAKPMYEVVRSLRG